MTRASYSDIEDILDTIPYRMAFAGGWIDQPFVSKLNPRPPGSMVVVGLVPGIEWMNRAGMASGTRDVALEVWGETLPDREPGDLVRELYAAENEGRDEPSGSQDMIGLIYPGVSRLDYDYEFEGGVFPRHIESNNDPDVARWLENVVHVLPVAARPDGYNPLGVKNLDGEWIARLGETGKDCFEAIVNMDVGALGASFDACMRCWETLLPHTVRHPAVTEDLCGILARYQAEYDGAMYSGCGGGYLYVVSENGVPDAFEVTVRVAGDKA
jgi:hypothetical protein